MSKQDKLEQNPPRGHRDAERPKRPQSVPKGPTPKPPEPTIERKLPSKEPRERPAVNYG